MGPPGSRLPRHAIAARAAALALLPLAAGCASGPEAPALPPAEAPPGGGLRVELVFGRDADLDLYVTDPLLETVYFANTPTRRGGTLKADRRCGSPAPRVESVVFERPPPGRYRVGVDYPQRCRLTGAPIPFVVRVRAEGLELEHRGEIEFASFLPVVLEFELP